MTTEPQAQPVAQDVLDEMMDLYEESYDKAAGDLGNLDFRQNKPAGSVLGETSIDGQQIQILQGDSLVKINGQSLPGRTLVYDTRTGVTSMVPTAQLAYQLSKRRQDGSRVYSRRLPAGIVPPTPIADTCVICYRNRGNKHRDFFSEFNLVAHYQSMHTLEWAAMERDREIKARRDDQNRMMTLIGALISAVTPSAAGKLPADVQQQISQLQELEQEIGSQPSTSFPTVEAPLTCPTCGFVAKSRLGLGSHMRSHT